MNVILDEPPLMRLKAAEVDISLHVKATMNVTPFVARQKVNGMLLDKVGRGLLAEPPDLVVAGNRLRWRAPIVLALPGRGRLGQVGVVDVDAQSGEVLADQVLINELTEYADRLASRPALPTES